MMNIILPAVLLSVLVLLVFLVPAESGEKISLGVTTLVAFTVFILIIAESVPRTSDGVPVLGINNDFLFYSLQFLPVQTTVHSVL